MNQDNEDPRCQQCRQAEIQQCLPAFKGRNRERTYALNDSSYAECRLTFCQANKSRNRDAWREQLQRIQISRWQAYVATNVQIEEAQSSSSETGDREYDHLTQLQIERHENNELRRQLQIERQEKDDLRRQLATSIDDARDWAITELEKTLLQPLPAGQQNQSRSSNINQQFNLAMMGQMLNPYNQPMGQPNASYGQGNMNMAMPMMGHTPYSFNPPMNQPNASYGQSTIPNPQFQPSQGGAGYGNYGYPGNYPGTYGFPGNYGFPSNYGNPSNYGYPGNHGNPGNDESQSNNGNQGSEGGA